MVRRKNTAGVLTTESPITIGLENPDLFSELRSNLAEINKTRGVEGYILRNSTTAVIDLQKTEKLVEYALLMSETVECLQQLSDLFSLDATHAIVEGKELKLICLVMGANTVGIFSKKNVDHDGIIKRISP